MGKNRPKSKHKVDDWEEFAEMHALENRLGELLLACQGIAIGMNDDLTVEVWGNMPGNLREADGEMVKLAQGADLREAVARAFLAAEARQRPLLRVITPEEMAQAMRFMASWPG